MAVIVDNFSGTPLEGKGLRIELDYAGGPGDQPTYVGFAPPGKLTSEPAWKIMKLVYVGSNLVRRLWADGDTKFDNVWDDRASLNYS
jgi:hypothetical protein